MNRRESLKTLAAGAASLALIPSLARASGLIPSGDNSKSSQPGPFTLPDLPYSFSAIEPSIDARTMEIHHDKHHAGYVRKTNAALENHPDLKSLPLPDLLKALPKIPEASRQTLQNNAGGHANHSLFWKILRPSNQEPTVPSPSLAKAINQTFGNFDSFQDEFFSAASTRFGSGWAWLNLTPERKLVVESTPNQDSPLMFGHTPILALDVWEHAYYLQYQNRRKAYITAFLTSIDWKAVSTMFESEDPTAYWTKGTRIG